LNDNTALGSPASITETCTTRHDAPNIGDHSLPLPLDIGTSHDLANQTDPHISNGLSQLSFPAAPVYAVRGCPNPFPDAQNTSEPDVVYTTDPGKALVTGLCSDMNRIKGPILRGLAERTGQLLQSAVPDESDGPGEGAVDRLSERTLGQGPEP
jgi:hypothetical protein